MKASQMFVKSLNLLAIGGYVMNIVALLDSQTSALQKVNGVFHLLLVVFLLTLETQEPAPNVEYLSLYKFSFGRGLFFIWISMILLNDSIVSIIGSSVTGVLGVCFVLGGLMQGCCCSGKKPDNSYIVLDSPESSAYAIAVAVPDCQPSLPLYTKNDPRRV